MMMQMVRVSAEFERNVLKGRMRKRFYYAKQHPRDCGRRPKLKQSKVRKLSNLLEKGNLHQNFGDFLNFTRER